MGWSDAELFQLAKDAHIPDCELYTREDWADSIDPMLIDRRNTLKGHEAAVQFNTYGVGAIRRQFGLKATPKKKGGIPSNPPCPKCGGHAKTYDGQHFTCAKKSCRHRFEGERIQR